MLNTIKLLISTNWFRKAEVRHQQRLKETTPAWGEIDEQDISKRVDKKRMGMLVAFVLVSASLAAGVLVALYINSKCPMSTVSVQSLRLVSLGIVAWAVLGRLGYETETLKGLTLLEITSMRSFKLFYVFGLFLTSVCLFVDPVST